MKNAYDNGFIVLFVVIFLGLLDASTSCSPQCVCTEITCPVDSLRLCQESNETWMLVRCEYLDSDSSIPSNTKSLLVNEELSSVKPLSAVLHGTSIRSLSIKLGNFKGKFDDFIDLLSELIVLNLSDGNLKVFMGDLQMFPKLEVLNVSENSFSGQLSFTLNSHTLKILDLSQNRIDGLSIEGKFPNLSSLLLQGNILKTLPAIAPQRNLKLLNLSRNLITFEPEGAESLTLDAVRCRLIPPSTKTLLIRDNLIRKIEANGCRLLEGLHGLEELDLGYNLLHTIPNVDEFGPNVVGTLKSLKLDGNSIYAIGPDAFSAFKRLQYLSLSNNHITSVPVELFHVLSRASLYSNTTFEPMISLSRNPISCDCNGKDLIRFLHTKNNKGKTTKSDMTCHYPTTLSGKRFIDLNENDLHCADVVLKQAANSTCMEHHECKVTCLFDGLPHPQVHWISPEREMISVETLAEDSSLRSIYSLSHDGQQLSITSLELVLTGIYRCIGNNSLGSSESFAQVGLLPDPMGSIVAIAVSAVSFAIAIAVNCANMCKCYCENLDMSKEDREEQELEDWKLESPMKSKRKGLHESEASLNANKYYRKYDFACQHIFLDAVIRGAHTVKQTLYDAKNSEFSNNVWEYASHLRDRLHIELPSSVQFPRVSMPSVSLPSISMPTISMPTMPNLQSINANIEKLGTSVISRSQNLATSVGSVFTLRWLRYGTSDNDSDSDVESSTVSQVQAHVHEHPDKEGSPTMYSQTSSKKFIPKSVWSRKPTSTECASTSRDSYITPSRSKSVRFGPVETFKVTRSSSCSELLSTVSVDAAENEDSIQQAHDFTVDLLDLRQFETSV